jgi:predicted nucleotidyltransferase
LDVAHPIRAVVPTLDGPVLEVLARTTRPLTGREIHRLARTGSPNGVRRALNRLAEQGLVHTEERAKAVFYAANRDHVAWPAVELLAALRRTFLDRLRAEFRSWRPKPAHASLFGSAARGDGDADSDIDLLLIRPDEVSEDDSPWADHVDRIRQQVQAWAGNRCQVFQLDLPRLAEHLRAGDPLVDQWLRDTVTLVDPDLRAVVRQLPTDRSDR